MSTVTYKPRRRRSGCLTALLVIVVLAIIVFWVSIGDKSTFITDLLSDTTAKYGEDEFPPFEEVWAYGKGSNKVIRVPITGMIMLSDNGSIFHPGGSADFALRAIHRATLDDRVQALILDIDSGGGGITASDIIYKALIDFKKSRPDRRVVAICGDTAASGAYYVALAADHIIAHPTTITGSIGVLIPSLNLRELALKHGIHDATIKSGKNKDLLSPLGEVTEVKLALLQSVVDALHDRFVSLVAKHRDIPEDEVRDLADGRIFTAADALKSGLIDETGYWQDAMTRTAELLNVETIIVYRYEDIFSFGELLRAHRKISPRAWLGLDEPPRLQYRWQP
jgi:protease-4